MPHITFTRETEDGEEHEARIPAEWAICGTCYGEGTHVNPSIDGHGIGAEEWANDWDDEEREGYFRGDYDVRCDDCDGSGKYLAPTLPDNPELWTDDQRAYVEQEEAEADYRAERAHEIKMGY